MTDEAPDVAAQSSASAVSCFRLMYHSRDRLDPDNRQAELSHLFTQARSANKRLSITGALLVSGGWFVQVLEGGESDVRTVFGRIQHDPRNDAVQLLSAGWVGERVFTHWSMTKVSADDDPDIPLIARVGEISPTTGRGTTSVQDRLLDVMREAAHHALVP